MEYSTSGISTVLRVIASALQYPVVILLIFMVAFSVFLLGWLLVEFFQEHRYLEANMPVLMDQVRGSGCKNAAAVIASSQLLIRQKAALTEITRHPELTDNMRESLAVKLVAAEQDYYGRRVKISDMTARIAPMIGLMGTLIPLGPGIIALGSGDTATLSQSLLIAFDTTIAGLAAAVLAMIVSNVRKTWYNRYMSILESMMEAVLDEIKSGEGPMYISNTVPNPFAKAPKGTKQSRRARKQQMMQQGAYPGVNAGMQQGMNQNAYGQVGQTMQTPNQYAGQQYGQSMQQGMNMQQPVNSQMGMGSAPVQPVTRDTMSATQQLDLARLQELAAAKKTTSSHTIVLDPTATTADDAIKTVEVKPEVETVESATNGNVKTDAHLADEHVADANVVSTHAKEQSQEEKKSPLDGMSPEQIKAVYLAIAKAQARKKKQAEEAKAATVEIKYDSEDSASAESDSNGAEEIAPTETEEV